MKIVKIIPLIALLFAFATILPAQKTPDSFVSDEILVKFAQSARPSAKTRAVESAGAATLETLGDLGWVRVKIGAGEDLQAALSRFGKMPGVEAAQPNFYYHLLATPNDPQFVSTGMYGLSKISAPQAWDLTTGSSAVVVADIDTGMRYTHQDLAANAWINPGEIAGNGVDDDNNGFIDDVHGWDFFYNDSDPIDDAGGHGTHTAGTIGAVGNNMLNVVGVNWAVKIMPIKIYSPNGADTTSAMLVNAYNYVRMMKQRGVNIRVTNNSYGGCGEACGYDQATKDALDAMGDAGILNVFAAGNSNVNNDVNPSGSYPSVYTSPSILAVAASTSTDARASFSSWGPTSVDLAAPGSGVLSTYNRSDTDTATLSGTSMATPHTAGAAALLSAYNPSLSAASLKATLMNTVDVITTPTNWSVFVKSGGRLNVFAALQNQTVCNFTPSVTTITARTKGGYYTVNIAAAQNCDFSVKSNANWIKVTGPDVQTGSFAVTFRVAFSPVISRSGTVTIGGQTVTVTQSRS
ncbi:MAG: S8 family serine peptidase [Pyrinomonadaceae bacterium]